MLGSYLIPLIAPLLCFSPLGIEQPDPQPSDAKSYLARGLQSISKGEWDKAIKDLSETLRLDPKCIDAYYNRAVAWGEKGEIAKATEDLSEVIRIDSKCMIAFYARGLMRFRARDFDKAIEDFDEAVRLDPKYSPAFGMRGSARANKGEYEKALKDLDESIRLDPKSGALYRFRGQVRLHRFEHEKAIEDLGEAVRLDPKDAEAYALRGMLRAASPDEQNRDAKKALEDAKKACDLTGWKAAYPLEAYAAACAESGDFSEAVKWQKKVLGDAVYLKSFAGKGAEERLKLYEAKKPFRMALTRLDRLKDDL